MSNNGVFSGLYFPAFGPNMERYLSAFSPNTGKYVTEKTPYLDTFHAVKVVDLIQKISLTFINGTKEAQKWIYDEHYQRYLLRNYNNSLRLLSMSYL